ncbi:MAG: hypothetical protein ABIA63_11065, partial [bacterium]
MIKIQIVCLFFVIFSSLETYSKYSSHIGDDDIDLTESWQILLEHGDQDVWKNSVRKSISREFHDGNPFEGIHKFIPEPEKWNKISEINYVWFIKKFFLPKTKSGNMIALNIGKGHWSREVWFNEEKIGDHL